MSTADRLGGAEAVATNLQEAYRARGHQTWLAVGRQTSTGGDVLPIPQHRHDRRTRLGRVLLDPARTIERQLGIEDFRFPRSRRLLELPPEQPDLVHCHNLHGGYFDLRTLPRLSHDVPVVLTLHDSWLLTGHCAHSFDCDRWTTGCGRCPDLTIYPAVRRDATRLNWLRKRRIYARSRLFVATPSRWLMARVERSMLAPAVQETRVIPNGVDLRTFRAGHSLAARERLGLRPDVPVLLLVGKTRGNPWRDASMLEGAFRELSATRTGSAVVLAAGEEGAPRRFGPIELRPIPAIADAAAMADHYRAADVYIHAARADTFPTALVEALACGTPVVATDVGGIPEQVRAEETGILVPAGDASALAAALDRLLGDAELRIRLGRNAAADARTRFDLELQASRYLDWYGEIIAA